MEKTTASNSLYETDSEPETLLRRRPTPPTPPLPELQSLDLNLDFLTLTTQHPDDMAQAQNAADIAALTHSSLPLPHKLQISQLPKMLLLPLRHVSKYLFLKSSREQEGRWRIPSSGHANSTLLSMEHNLRTINKRSFGHWLSSKEGRLNGGQPIKSIY